MKDRKLAVRYARALLSAFPDPAKSEAADTFLMALRQAMTDSADLRAMLVDPAVPRATRIELLRRMVEQSGLPNELGNFLATLVDNNRTAALPSIAEVFHELREEAMGVVPAEITTAEPLGEELRQRARESMEKLTGRQVRLTCKVDAALLGGAVTRIGSTVYDGSLRNQLTRLRRRMSQE